MLLTDVAIYSCTAHHTNRGLCRYSRFIHFPFTFAHLRLFISEQISIEHFKVYYMCKYIKG